MPLPESIDSYRGQLEPADWDHYGFAPLKAHHHAFAGDPHPLSDSERQYEYRLRHYLAVRYPDEWGTDARFRKVAELLSFEYPDWLKWKYLRSQGISLYAATQPDPDEPTF